MVRENKIRMMTKLAILEEDHGDMIEKAKTYYRSDYISGYLLKNIFFYTLAFLIGLLLWSSYRMEALLQELNTMDIIGLAWKILIFYGITMAGYLVCTYVIYYKRFNNAEKKLTVYRLLLDKLLKEYDKEYGDGKVTGHKKKTNGNIQKI